MYTLKAQGDFAEAKKTSLDKDRMKLQGHVKHGTVLSEERRMYGSSAELAE